MYLHSDKSRFFATALLMMAAMLLPSISFGQGNPVTITTVVYPPYSPRFSYYIDHSDKINVTLINTSGQSRDIYLKGSFTGDNGIVVTTEEGYKPPVPLTLEPGIPFRLTQGNIGDIFSAEHLVYSGISSDELLQMQALPEGNYQICFTAFDYYTDQQLSADEPSGCSNYIMIQYVDPPQILFPVCGDTIVATTPQNLLFSWTIPVQTGVNFTYRFIMVEMHPGTRNPYDALASAVPPYFYETEANTNQLIMGPSEPQLVEGRSYAFIVQAVDPDNEIVFKNNGTSEACWFKYQSPESGPETGSDSIIIPGMDDFTHDFELIPHTTISGQLHYRLASEVSTGAGAGTGAGGGQSNSTGFNYTHLLNQGSNSGNGANSNNMGVSGFSGFSGFNFTPPSGGNFSFVPPFGTGTINESVYSINNAEPLRNTTVRLAVRFSYKNPDGFFDTRAMVNTSGSGGSVNLTGYRFYDLHGNEISPERVENMVNRILDVCTTDDQGNFNFDFQTDFFTGPVYAVSSSRTFGNNNYDAVISLKLEVINQKFCSPDVDIFAKPGDNIQLQPQVALIKDYDLHLKVISAYDYYEGSADDNTIHMGKDRNPKIIPGGKPIPGAIVKVLRDMQRVNNEHPAVLMAEGQKLGSVTKNENGEFKDVFIGRADSAGRVVIPHLVEHWAVTDGENQSPYFFSVRTRSEQADSTYENTLYNFEPFFGTLTGLRISVESGATTMFDDDAGFTDKAPVVYNHFYTPPHSANEREVDLMAAPPEIKGRLMVKSNLENIGLADETISLYGGSNIGSAINFESSATTNKAGFFRFSNLPVNVDENGIARGPYRYLMYSSGLYQSFMYPPSGQPPLNLIYGQLFFKEFQLTPKELLKGKVVDETGKPVASYVKLLPGNPYVKTEPRWEYDENGNLYKEAEVFEIPARNFPNRTNRIEIQPLSNQYFPDTVEVGQFNPHQRMVFTVYRKMHRLRLQVRNKENNKPVPGADVVVGDTMALGKTDANGMVELLFPSPGEQFIVKIKAAGYSPKQTSYNIPVSNGWQTHVLTMEPAMSIHGTVTEFYSGEPVDSALIFIELQNTDGHRLYLESYSDSQGKYTLAGIPMSLTSVDVHVGKQGKNPAYIGTTQTININPFAYPVPSYDFKLKKADGWDLSNIWGFPVTIEKMRTRPGFGTLVSGYFHDLPNVPVFNTINSNEKIYFSNLKINRGPNGEIVPVNDFVETETDRLPVKITGGFEGDLFIPSDWQYDFPLKVVKTGDYAKLSAGLQVDLASFKFAYDFQGDLFLGDDTVHNDVTVFQSSNPSAPPRYKTKYYVFDMTEGYEPKPYPIKDFRVFGFNASSTFGKSYFQNGTFHIGTTLHTDIPLPNGQPSLDLKVQAGEIQITKENMDLVHYPGDRLSFELEKWRIASSNGWTFDKTRDAIVIPKGMIYTGLGVDAAITGLLIRPDALREGVIDMKGGLSLGGIAKLTLDKNVKPVFNYDAGVGHYLISMVGNANGPVAWINHLPATPDRLEFTSIGMLSDNSTILSLNKKMRFYDIMDIYVDQIMSGEGYFKLGGMPDLGIPGYVPTMAVMNYTKKGNRLVPKLEPLNGAVDCNANVVFKPEQTENAQSISNQLFTAYGDFFIKPPPGESGDKVTMRGHLVKTSTECYIDAVPGQLIAMGKDKMKVIDGKISVETGTWGDLAFNCNTNSQGLKDENVVSYLVHGGIEANSDKISVDDIDTPLGSLSLAYLFDEKALVGDLTITKKLELGFATINSGSMATRFDPHGFYLAFAGNITMTQQEYLGGFVLGVYEKDLTPVVKNILHEFRKNPPDFSSIHGFYAIGQRNLIDKTFPVPTSPPVMASVKAGLGAYVHFDYQNPMFVVGGYAFIDAEGGMQIPPPVNCYIGVRSSVDFGIDGGYENEVLFIESCGILKVNAEACGMKAGISVLNRNRLSSDGESEFTLELGDSCE